MDLSPAQRVLAFLGIVVVLGGMGAYLLIPGVRSALGQGHRPAAATPSALATGAAGTSPSTPASTAPFTPATPAAPAPDIYQWLPFSQADLARAASVTEAFGSAYDTFSYREGTSSYVARFRGLATNELSSTLARAYGTPGVASQRTGRRPRTRPAARARHARPWLRHRPVGVQCGGGPAHAGRRRPVGEDARQGT